MKCEPIQYMKYSCQEIPHFLCTFDIQHQVHNGLPLNLVSCQMNPFEIYLHTHTIYCRSILISSSYIWLGFPCGLSTRSSSSIRAPALMDEPPLISSLQVSRLKYSPSHLSCKPLAPQPPHSLHYGHPNIDCMDTPFNIDCMDTPFNPLNPELNPICYLLALSGAHHFLHVSRIRVKLLTFRRLMSYIYGAPILDVSRSHTTTQHSR